MAEQAGKRGSSPSAERQEKGFLSRTQIASRVAQARLDDQVCVKWRIVPDKKAADTSKIPWEDYQGRVVEVDEEHKTISVDFGPKGVYAIPPDPLYKAFIEIKGLDVVHAVEEEQEEEDYEIPSFSKPHIIGLERERKRARTEPSHHEEEQAETIMDRFSRACLGKDERHLCYLPGTKVMVPNAPDPRQAVFYPHIWVRKLQAGIPVGLVTAEWRTTIQEVYACIIWRSAIAEAEFEQHKNAFIAWLKVASEADDIPISLWRMGFLSTEALQRCAMYATGQAEKVDTFVTKVSSMWQKLKVEYDVLKIASKASTFRQPQTNQNRGRGLPFFRGRGRGARPQQA